MRIAYLSFRHFSRSSRLYIYSLAMFLLKCLLSIFLSVPFLVLLALFPPIFTPHLELACMLLINAYCPSFFPSLFHLSALFPPFFPSLSILFPPFFPPHLKIVLPASTKCILPSFFPSLSSPFRVFPALFSVACKCRLTCF
jgi:hypothetical protein